MRIITGTARGMKLSTLTGEDTRPTPEMVKEAVFSSLQFDLEGRRFLDLFAGSGQMALEALSRGADKAVLVDGNPDAVTIITANAQKTHLYKSCRVVCSQWNKYLAGIKSGEKFDIVYLDPPFSLLILPEVLVALSESGALKETSIIVCESESIPVFPEGSRADSLYTVYKQARYGRIHISYLSPKKPV